jgi:hypothetical protein
MDILDKITKKYDTDLIYVFHKNKPIITSKNIIELKKNIKENVKNPSKDISVFIITFVLDKDSKKPLIINCVKNTITPKSNLVARKNDLGQSIFYTKDDLKKYGYNDSHISKIIKAIQTGDMPYDKDSVSIGEVLSLFD